MNAFSIIIPTLNDELNIEKNVIHLLKSCGFRNIECVNKSITDYEEQRSTKWMKGKSLKDFIYPNGTTIEGHSNFYRAIFIARKK